MATDPIQALRELDQVLRDGGSSPSLALSRVRRAVAHLVSERQTLQADVNRYRLMLERAARVQAIRGLEPIAQEALDCIIEVVEAERGFIGLHQGDDQPWRLLVARNLERQDIDDPKGQVSTTIISEALRSRQPVVTADAMDSPDFSGKASVSNLRLRSVACLPVLHEGTLIGFVYLDNTTAQGLFDEAALVALRSWLPLLGEAIARAQADQGTIPGLPGIVTRSPRMEAELSELARFARFDVSILLTGETGTGKSMIARTVHAASHRAEKPFVHVNCGAIPEALIEGELFGAEAGAYTGARRSREGRFEAAHGGTLFLDELDSMPLACQVKLLVALQERRITRLGSNKAIDVDVRIMAAMASDPDTAIHEDRLREDLYYRLAVVVVPLPPLRERLEDLPLLAQHILEQNRHRYGLPSLRLAPSAVDSLMAHDWPGNVRELENSINRAALLAKDGVITMVRPPPRARAQSGVPTPAGTLPLLTVAARRFLEKVEGHESLRKLSSLDAFKGIVMLAAAARHGGREGALELFGEEAAVRNRNHHRLFRRETRALTELLGLLDEQLEAELQAHLD